MSRSAADGPPQAFRILVFFSFCDCSSSPSSSRARIACFASSPASPEYAPSSSLLAKSSASSGGWRRISCTLTPHSSARTSRSPSWSA